MRYDAVLFDLDGTLTDSGEGIINCAELALRRFNLNVPDRTAMRVFVGPPLRDTFVRFGVPEDRVEEAIAAYRSRYTTVGKFENFPYPDIPWLLNALQAQGIRLYVATSKPESISIEILEHYDLAKYFSCICGATHDGSRETKADVIAHLLAKTGESGKIVMVGDTKFDVIGASALSIPAIGVSWGYGDVTEMRNAGATVIVSSAKELFRFLTEV